MKKEIELLNGLLYTIYFSDFELSNVPYVI